jgi:hypothetical protein
VRATADQQEDAADRADQRASIALRRGLSAGEHRQSQRPTTPGRPHENRTWVAPSNLYNDRAMTTELSHHHSYPG